MGVQLDLLARDPSGLLYIIEVKAQSARGLAHLSYVQRARLIRICGFLAEFEPTELGLVLVEGQKVALLPVDALTAK